MRIRLGRYTRAPRRRFWPVSVEKIGPGLVRLLVMGGPSSSRYGVDVHGGVIRVPRHNSSALLHHTVIVRDEKDCEMEELR